MDERKISSTNFSNQQFLEDRCFLNEMINLLSKRWITEVLFCIEEGKNRFSNIKDDLKYISDNALASRLKLLEKYGLISKKNFMEIPPRVEYSLTDSGIHLCSLLDELCTFGENSMQQKQLSKN
jgi:DNA-binding HxlR family transcriptional regulator